MGMAGLNRDGTDEWGPPRRVGTGIPPAVPLDLDWTRALTFEQSEAPAEFVDFAGVVLSQQGLTLSGVPILLRHRPGDRGLPPAAAEGDLAFAIDLTEARRTLDGGLLLFVQPTGRVSGWRAEAGVMTVWSGADPELTELAPGAPDRLTLIGRARRA